MKKIAVCLSMLLWASASYANLSGALEQAVNQEAAKVAIAVRFEYSYRSDYTAKCTGYLINPETILVRRNCVESNWGGKIVYYSLLLANNSAPTIGGDLSRDLAFDRDVAYIRIDPRFTKGLPIMPIYHSVAQKAQLDVAFHNFLLSHGVVEGTSRRVGNHMVKADTPFIYNGRLVGIVQDSISHYCFHKLPYEKLVIIDRNLAQVLN